MASSTASSLPNRTIGRRFLDGVDRAAFHGGDYGVSVVPLGVDRFGQSGSRQALYEHAGLDAGQIVNAALLALGLAEG